MRILYIGDIMGKFGRRVVEQELPQIRSDYRPEIIIAQAENVTHGKGISRQHYDELKLLGIHGFTSGNHIYAREEITPLLDDPDHPITQPANYPAGTSGIKYKFLPTGSGDLLLVTLMGQIVGKDADVPADNPLHVIDAVLRDVGDGGHSESSAHIGTLVNFHGDYSSEKVVIGQYLDGKATAVLGDHWHVPTADARVLPGRTAHISDVGMVGARNASLGIKTDVIVKRWRGDNQGSNELVEEGEYQFCGVVIDFDESTGHARDIQQILRYGTLM